MSVLVVAEHRQGRVREVTCELVSAGAQLDDDVAVALIHRDPASLRSQLRLQGVRELIEVATATEEFDGDVHAAALEALIHERNPQAVLLPFSVDSMGFAAGVAANLGLGFASDVWAVERRDGGLVARRSFYSGKVSGELDFPGSACVLLLLRSGAWPAAPEGGDPSTTRMSLEPLESRVRHLRFEEAPAGDVDITAAGLILAIGRGIGKPEEIPRFARLAERMGATLAVSRPLVDAGWMPASRQVGQSGRTVKPKVYLAFGISGAVQHLAGMKDSGTIIAVNTDPEAAIFGAAHYGAVTDLFDVAEELERLL